MNDAPRQPPDQQPMSRRVRVDQACDRFEQHWRAGHHPRIEDFLDQAEDHDRQHLLGELIAMELMLVRDNGQDVDLQQYRQRFPADAPIVERVLASFDPRLAETRAQESTGAREPDGELHVPAHQSSAENEKLPAAIDRYRILKELGRGGFAVVYLAQDTQLGREVALKVPRLDKFVSDKVLDLFVQEAPNAAQLDHPGIVRVYDVKREPELVYRRLTGIFHRP